MHLDQKWRVMALAIFIALMSGGFLVAQDTQDEEPSRGAYELMTRYYNDKFTPFAKGNWYVGFAFSLTDQSLENQSRLLYRVVDGGQFDYSLTFKGGHFIGEHFMVGLAFEYSREKFVGAVIQESDTVQTNFVSSMGVIIPSIKSYFSLTKNNRLSFFNEIGMGFGFGSTVSRDIKNQDEINKSYQESFLFSLGISPGITFFAIENFAFEIQLNNLIGYQLEVKEGHH